MTNQKANYIKLNLPKINRYHDYKLLRVAIEQALERNYVSVILVLSATKTQPILRVLDILITLGLGLYYKELKTLGCNRQIEFFFNYGGNSRCVLRKLELMSSASNLRYVKPYQLKAWKNNMYYDSIEYILLTKRGTLTSNEAIQLNIGGLLLYKIKY